MAKKTQQLANVGVVISSFSKYLDLWINFETKAQYSKDYTREFVALMLLKAKGELARNVSVLAEHQQDDVHSLIKVKEELDRIFNEKIVTLQGEQIRDTLLSALDCRSLVSMLNDYLNLQECFASKSPRGVQVSENLVDIGCELILQRDEIQLVIDELSVLVKAKKEVNLIMMFAVLALRK